MNLASRSVVAAASSALALSLVPASGACAASAPAQAAAPADAAEALAAARRALGWDDLAPGPDAMRITGAARVLGTETTQTIVFDEARYFESFDGAMAQTSGTDGKTTWVRDWSGTPRVLVLGDRANAELERLFTTGAWTVPGPALRFDDAVAREGDELVLSFAHEDGIVRGTIRLDAATRRARTAKYASDDSPTEWRFADYQDRGGFVYPATIEAAHAGQVQRFAATKVERVARVDAQQFAPRVEPPRDARFDAAVAPAIEVKVAKTGHLLVHPLVDGKDLGWFIFDTGAGTNCIANDVTQELGTEPFGEIAARGIGGTVPARFWRAHDLRLGPLTVESPRFMGLDLAFLEPHFGVKVGGILGFELLARCLVELDMKAGTIAIHDPKRYALPGGGRWEDVLLYGRHPCVRATFEGHDGVFRLDTGAAQDTVTFHYQATADLGLAKGRATEASVAGGVGGNVETSVGEMKSFRLGGRELGPVEVGFALEDTGAFADDYTAGNIGGRLLEPFRMVFDYPGGRVGFVPR